MKPFVVDDNDEEVTPAVVTADVFVDVVLTVVSFVDTVCTVVVGGTVVLVFVAKPELKFKNSKFT